jgi:hypothetical protein
MTQRLKITLTDTAMDELRSAAARDGVPVSRIAAERVSQPPSNNEPDRDAVLLPAQIADDDFVTDNHAPWIEPIMGDEAWRRRMWASIVALYGRYPHALAHLRDGWWNQSSHFETLCALVVWRDWIDIAADDPRHELAFQAQLTDYSLQLRQEGGSVTDAWKPGAPPIEWFSAPSS